MGRKSTKQARFDSLSQREQNQLRKRKLKAGRKDANRWANKVLAKLEEAKGVISDDQTKEAN